MINKKTNCLRDDDFLTNIANIDWEDDSGYKVSCCSIIRFRLQRRLSVTGVILSPIHQRTVCPILDFFDDFDHDMNRRLSSHIMTPKYRITALKGEGTPDFISFSKIQSSLRTLAKSQRAERYKYIKNRKEQKRRPAMTWIFWGAWVNQNESTERCCTTKDGAIGTQHKNGKKNNSTLLVSI